MEISKGYIQIRASFFFFFSSEMWFTSIPLNAPIINFSLKILPASSETLWSVVRHYHPPGCCFFEDVCPGAFLFLSSLLMVAFQDWFPTISLGVSSPHACAGSPASSVSRPPLSWFIPSSWRSVSSSDFLEKSCIEGKYFEIIMLQNIFFPVNFYWYLVKIAFLELFSELLSLLEIAISYILIILLLHLRK